MHRRRNLANSVVPTLLARGSRVAFHATMCRAEGDLEAYWNRILTIFDPYTFSHSQGHEVAYPLILSGRPLSVHVGDLALLPLPIAVRGQRRVIDQGGRIPAPRRSRVSSR